MVIFFGVAGRAGLEFCFRLNRWDAEHQCTHVKMKLLPMTHGFDLMMLSPIKISGNGVSIQARIQVPCSVTNTIRNEEMPCFVMSMVWLCRASRMTRAMADCQRALFR